MYICICPTFHAFLYIYIYFFFYYWMYLVIYYPLQILFMIYYAKCMHPFICPFLFVFWFIYFMCLYIFIFLLILFYICFVDLQNGSSADDDIEDAQPSHPIGTYALNIPSQQCLWKALPRPAHSPRVGLLRDRYSKRDGNRSLDDNDDDYDDERRDSLSTLSTPPRWPSG